MPALYTQGIQKVTQDEFEVLMVNILTLPFGFYGEGQVARYLFRFGVSERLALMFERAVRTSFVTALLEITRFTDIIKSAFLEVYGKVVKQCDVEGIKHYFGEMAADYFNLQLKQRFNTTSGIDDFYDEMLPEKFGTFAATTINEQVSKVTKSKEQIFTTIYPTENITKELDAYLVETLNTKLKTHITGVIGNKDFASELKSELVDIVKVQIGTRLDIVKQHMITKLNINPIIGDRDLKMMIVNNVFDEILSDLQNYKAYGLNTTISANLKTYISTNKGRINVAARQREYRRTHKENRTWEAR